MKACVFCQIIKKKIPARIIYESKKCIAFLDIEPITPFHTLIVPKKHVKSLEEIDEKIWKEIKVSVKKICNIYDVKSFNLFCSYGREAGQEINHLHFHLLPRRKNDNLEFFRYKTEKEAKKQNNGKIVKFKRNFTYSLYSYQKFWSKELYRNGIFQKRI